MYLVVLLVAVMVVTMVVCWVEWMAVHWVV